MWVSPEAIATAHFVAMVGISCLIVLALMAWRGDEQPKDK